jgi:UDP-glucose 4-epimerase
MNKQTIVITGGYGFIGNHIYNRLHGNKSYHIRRFPKSQLDLANTESVKSTLKTYQPNVIIHLGGISNPSLLINEEEMMNTNIMGTQRLLEYSPKCCRFIFASSIVVCGNAKFQKHEGNGQDPQSLYAASKAAAENLVSAYTNIGSVNGISLRLCATVGAGLTHGCLMDFIRKVKSPKERFDILGEFPGPYKPYLYISDVVNAIELAISSNMTGPFNICNENIICINDIANIVLDYYSVNKEPHWTGQNFVGDNSCLKYSNKLASSLLKWQPKYNSYDAIYQALDDIQKNEDYNGH